jgi:hypothetical protein
LALIPINTQAQFSINSFNYCYKSAIFLYINSSAMHKLSIIERF